MTTKQAISVTSAIVGFLAGAGATYYFMYERSNKRNKTVDSSSSSNGGSK